MLWIGRTLTLKATLISSRDHGNLTFEVGGQQFSLPHLALIAQDVIDQARAAHLVLDADWLEAQRPLQPTMPLDAEVRSVRDLSNVVLAVGRSSEGRLVPLDQRVILAAAGLGEEPLGASGGPPAAAEKPQPQPQSRREKPSRREEATEAP